MANIRWIDNRDETLATEYDPVTSLFLGKLIGNPKVAAALNDQGAVFGVVETGTFFVQTADGRKPLTDPIALENIPDMAITATHDAEGITILELTSESRERLSAIKRGEQSVAQHIGIKRREQSSVSQSLWSIQQE